MSRTYKIALGPNGMGHRPSRSWETCLDQAPRGFPETFTPVKRNADMCDCGLDIIPPRVGPQRSAATSYLLI